MRPMGEPGKNAESPKLSRVQDARHEIFMQNAKLGRIKNCKKRKTNQLFPSISLQSRGMCGKSEGWNSEEEVRH